MYFKHIVLCFRNLMDAFSSPATYDSFATHFSFFSIRNTTKLLCAVTFEGQLIESYLLFHQAVVMNTIHFLWERMCGDNEPNINEVYWIYYRRGCISTDLCYVNQKQLLKVFNFNLRIDGKYKSFLIRVTVQEYCIGRLRKVFNQRYSERFSTRTCITDVL